MNDPCVDHIIDKAKAVGEQGHFAVLTGVTDAGRPIVVMVGVGDGCAELYALARKNRKIVEYVPYPQPEGKAP